jgi:hypothetical protein
LADVAIAAAAIVNGPLAVELETVGVATASVVGAVATAITTAVASGWICGVTGGVVAAVVAVLSEAVALSLAPSLVSVFVVTLLRLPELPTAS